MEEIKLAADRAQQIEQGKKLYLEKKDTVYTEKICGSIWSVIEKNMKDAQKPQKWDMFYGSIYDYWVYGTNISEEFFYGFQNLTHEEKEEYITFRNRYEYIWHMNEKSQAHVLNNKYETYAKLKEFYRRDVILLKDESDYGQFCAFVERHPVFIVKPSCLGLTIGVHKMEGGRREDREALFHTILAEGRSIKEAYRWKNWEDTDSVVLEELICQTEQLARIHPDSVNGVRISTVRVGSQVHIFYPWLKIGNNREFITAEAFGSLMAGIDPDTGVVDTLGVDESGIEYEYHPCTNVRIPGYVVPRWGELTEMVTELAGKFQDIAYIGWDMALTQQGWCIIEGNFDGEFLGQLVYHKGIKRELESILQWKPNKKYWWQ